MGYIWLDDSLKTILALIFPPHYYHGEHSEMVQQHLLTYGKDVIHCARHRSLRM